MFDIKYPFHCRQHLALQEYLDEQELKSFLKSAKGISEDSWIIRHIYSFVKDSFLLSKVLTTLSFKILYFFVLVFIDVPP